MGAPADGSRAGILDDSRATLRQVEKALLDIEGTERLARVDRVLDDLERRPSGLRDLVVVLVRTYTEIVEVIESLRRSRGLLERAAMERIKSTHQKLAEVSSATEVAATGMLDGLDRALVLVDHLEASAETPPRRREGSADAARYRGELRDELHQLINLLQFQDITAQQLGYASTVLLDIEERMVRLSSFFDLRGAGIEELLERAQARHDAEGAHVPARDEGDHHDAHDGAGASGTRLVCDPGASTLDAEGRQALADEIFTTPGG